jgi:hypothetical protein
MGLWPLRAPYGRQAVSAFSSKAACFGTKTNKALELSWDSSSAGTEKLGRAARPVRGLGRLACLGGWWQANTALATAAEVLACRGEGSVVGPLLAARALPLPGGGRAASAVLSSALLAIYLAIYLTRTTLAVVICGSGSTYVSELSP